MQERIFKIKINYLIGEFLWRERTSMQWSYEHVSSLTQISEATLREYERGTSGVPLHSLNQLVKLYRVEEKEFQFYLERAMKKAREPWSSDDYLRVTLHRLRIHL